MTLTYFDLHSGSQRRCDVRALKVGDGVSCTWRDVTERMQLIEKYRLLAENASDIVYEIDNHGEIKWISPSTGELGWDANTLLGSSIFDLIFEEDHSKARLAGDDLYRGAPKATFEARFRAESGELHWMSVSAKPLRTVTEKR